MKNKMLTNLVNKLIEKKLTISCCESLTGGLFAAEIVKISGASNTFRGGYVTYQDIAKEILLPNAKEGDVIKIEKDKKETKNRKKNIQKLMNDVFED